MSWYLDARSTEEVVIMRIRYRVLLSAIVIASAPFGIAAAQTTTDDVKWINQCLEDNKNENPNKEVVLIYCTCMNEKMDSSETRSITQWEKVNETERKACDRKAGWR